MKVRAPLPRCLVTVMLEGVAAGAGEGPISTGLTPGASAHLFWALTA